MPCILNFSRTHIFNSAFGGGLAFGKLGARASFSGNVIDAVVNWDRPVSEPILFDFDDSAVHGFKV